MYKLMGAVILVISMSATSTTQLTTYAAKVAQSAASYLKSNCDHSEMAYYMRRMPRSVLK